MKLYQLLKDYPVLNFSGSALVEINQLAYDSRRVLEGTLFVCLLGERLDGHSFIIEALSRKAAALLVQQDLDAESQRYLNENSPSTAVVRVKDSREALAFISCNFYPFSREKLNVHLLIGEMGKGSCSHMIYRLLNKLNQKASLIDDMQILSDGKKRYLPRNHPEMTEICSVLSELQEGTVLLPFSYMDIEHKRGFFLTPATCTLLQADRTELRKALSLGTPETFYIVNADALSPDARQDLEQIDKRCLSYGIEETATLRGRALRIETRERMIGTAFVVDYPDGMQADYFVALPGRHQVYNALALLAWAYHEKIAVDVLQKYLRELSLPGHSEQVVAQNEENQNFTLMIDNAWTPQQMKSLLQSLRPYCRNRLLVMASAGGDRSTELRRALAEEAVHAADYVCFTVSNPRSEGAAAILKDMTLNLHGQICEYSCVEDRAEAIRHIVSMAQSGDLVILSGKADENYHVDAQSTEPFSEYDVAKAALSERAALSEGAVTKQDA